MFFLFWNNKNRTIWLILYHITVHEFSLGNTKCNVRFVRIGRRKTEINGVIPNSKENKNQKETKQQPQKETIKPKPNPTRISKEQIIRFHYAIATGLG